MRVLSLFSGIGAFEVALDELGIEWELDHYCEIDKYASQSYNCIHGTTDEDNLKDVTNIDYSKIGEVDLVTYGFPCQDISLAGNQKGFFDEDGNLTRSGLFFNAADIIRHTNPKFAIFENVKNLTGKKFKVEFETVLSTLDELGYNTYWKVLNAKDYGIPQNRERVFGISIRKDIDKGYTFPQGFKLTLRLKDMLEEQVEEKYYLSNQVQERFKLTDSTLTKSIIGTTAPSFRTIGQRDLVYQENGIMGSLVATDYKQPKQILESKRIGGLFDDEKGKHQAVVEPSYIEKKYDEFIEKNGYVPEMFNPYNCAEITDVAPTQSTQRGGTTSSATVLKMEQVICRSVGRNPNNPSTRKAGEPTEQRIEVNTKGLCNTLTTVQKDNYVLEPKVINPLKGKTDNGWHFEQQIYDENGIIRAVKAGGGSGNIPKVIELFRIRKLTPRECWRLMGFKDKYFDRVKGVSNTQLYKQAGNSIVVSVIEAIFESLAVQYPSDFVQRWGDDL